MKVPKDENYDNDKQIKDHDDWLNLKSQELRTSNLFAHREPENYCEPMG